MRTKIVEFCELVIGDVFRSNDQTYRKRDEYTGAILLTPAGIPPEKQICNFFNPEVVVTFVDSESKTSIRIG